MEDVAADDPSLQRGAYLTNGTRLLRVVDTAPGVLLLEDCAAPELAPEEWPIGAVLEQLRLVRRAESAGVS